MPYKSQAQAGYFHTHKAELERQGVDVGEWDRATKGKHLPQHLAKGGTVYAKGDGGATTEYAKGGAVKSGPAWEEGLKNGTQVQHDDGKSDGKNIGRGRVVTFWAGGKVEAPKGVAPATKLPGGAGGARGRLAKEHRAERDYAKAK